MTNIKATYFSEVDMAGKLKCVPLWFIGIDIEWKSWQNSPNSKSKPMIDIDNFDSIPIYNSKPTFIAWHWCQLCDFNYSQTTAHIIGECPALVGPRLEVFDAHVLEPPFNLKIRSVIKFLRLAEIEALNLKEKDENQTS